MKFLGIPRVASCLIALFLFLGDNDYALGQCNYMCTCPFLYVFSIDSGDSHPASSGDVELLFFNGIWNARMADMEYTSAVANEGWTGQIIYRQEIKWRLKENFDTGGTCGILNNCYSYSYFDKWRIDTNCTFDGQAIPFCSGTTFESGDSPILPLQRGSEKLCSASFRFDAAVQLIWVCEEEEYLLNELAWAAKGVVAKKA